MNKYKNMDASAKAVFWVWVALAVSLLLMVGGFFATYAGFFLAANLLISWSQGVVIGVLSFYFAVFADDYIDSKIAMLRGEFDV